MGSIEPAHETMRIGLRTTEGSTIRCSESSESTKRSLQLAGPLEEWTFVPDVDRFRASHGAGFVAERVRATMPRRWWRPSETASRA